MSFRDLPVPLTDPEAMRALAHPGRLAIFTRLLVDGPATATECADVAELSPSACSYHLRALARWGFVEEAPTGSDGRERRWQATTRQITVTEDSDKSSARLLIDQALQMSARAVGDYLDNDDRPEWREAAIITGVVLHATPAELTELGQRIQALLAPYVRAEPVERPPGAERVLYATQAVPWPGP